MAQIEPIVAGLPPVVLLHGWGGSCATAWVDSGWHERLTARGRRVIGIDLPGHGSGEAPTDPAGYANLAAMVRSRLPASGTVDVIAYSLGAKLALAMAVAEPGWIRRAVLCGVGANVFAAEKHGEELARVVEEGVPDGTPLAIAALARYGLAAGNDARRLAAVLRRPPNPTLTADALRDVRCPVLLAVGERDAVAQPVDALARVLPCVELLTLQGVDHINLLAHPGLMDAAIAFCAA